MLQGPPGMWCQKALLTSIFFFVEDCYVVQCQYVEGVVGDSRVCVTVVGVLAIHVGSQSSTAVF